MRARPIRKFALLARVVSLLLDRFSGANPPRILCAYCCSVPELGIGHRAPADQATPAAPWPPQAPAGDDHGGRVEGGADLDKADKYEATPLMVAAYNGKSG
eukprot:COSAG06_NODE_20753_length_783_cov_0.577485_1_plen_100_part_10